MVTETTTSNRLHGYGRHTPLEDNRGAVLALLVQKTPESVIAERFGVSRQAVSLFKNRNRADIELSNQIVQRSIEDYAIASKVQRIADYDEMRTLLRSEIDANGIAWDEQTRHGTKRHISGAVQELRGTLKQAAEELDQLPRAGITVNNQNVVIVKQVSGSDKALT